MDTFNKLIRSRLSKIEYKHLLILFLIIILFQVGLSFVHRASLNDFLDGAGDWYKRDSAERFANVTTTSLELLVDTRKTNIRHNEEEKKELIKAFNIILSWQNLNKRVKNISLVFNSESNIYSINDGNQLYNYLYENTKYPSLKVNGQELTRFKGFLREIEQNEKIVTSTDVSKNIYIAVPFSPKGELLGILYMKYKPDFSPITREITAGYDRMGLIYSSLIIFGLLVMYYISTYTLRERDYTHKLYLSEHEENLKRKIALENETLFTKRIYHTHHKAEKVMGFIKSDLLQVKNPEIKNKLTKYANFISRVIYDMKWYEPPVNTIRNQIYRTDINDVIRFLTENIFKRVSDNEGSAEFNLELDNSLPVTDINEYVIWEVFEPLIQNSLEHGGSNYITITIKSGYDKESGTGEILIQDDGQGIPAEFLLKNENNVQRIFLEHVTSGEVTSKNRGYGCYIAHTIATKRCGWQIEADNLADGGCEFRIKINYQAK